MFRNNVFPAITFAAPKMEILYAPTTVVSAVVSVRSPLNAVVPGATNAKVPALNEPLAVVLEAEVTVTRLNGIKPPTAPSNVTVPVPAARARSKIPGIALPLSAPLKLIFPRPSPVFRIEFPVRVVAIAVNVTLSLDVVTLPAVKIPLALAKETAPSELILAPEAIINVPNASTSPKLLAFKVTIPLLPAVTVFTVLFSAIVSVTTFRPANAE